MQSKRWFKIIIFVMLAAMLASTVLVIVEPFIYG
ncbi:stressosome-associated protein Prli42 [Paenibacillus popilliae]|uniref:DUF4044 domain-containing protein n=1 Tax=Paenibacillus popilliae TaxID=78057 RepID=A0ABY3B0C6_PAEPP|nr:stressosome-associated protein Prli42 [Paenibacillus sp. SDF0028]TQR46940.1 DUF4044 domain-containing protein [Paenibacillus sp. SDF0028]